ncbi:maestro heat-like repeat family member 5 [Cricetulus griseus]
MGQQLPSFPALASASRYPLLGIYRLQICCRSETSHAACCSSSFHLAQGLQGQLQESQDYASWDRQSSPATILLCGSKSSQSSLVPKEHQMFMEEAYNSAICFKMLRDTGTLDPLQIKYITKKMRKMAQRSPSMVMESIHDYFKDNPEISSRHRFRLFQVLQAVIGVPDVLEEKWQRDFMQLALEHMTKSTGIALTVGLAAVRHLDDAWAVLEQFGRSTPIKWSLQNFSLKDEILKQSFLTAIMMLIGAISRNEGAHSYEFSQTSELLECLMILMEKEPQDTLLTSIRQQAIHIVSRLCALRPPIDVDKKSRLLSICFCSVFALPLLDALEKHTCLFLEPPNIQGLYNQTMEAVDHMLQCFMMQNPTTNELYFLLSTKETFRRVGQLVAMLGILCQDADRTVQCFSLEAMGHFYQLLIHWRAEEIPELERENPQEFPQPDAVGAALWSSGDHRGTLLIPRDMASKSDNIFFMSSNQAIKEIMNHLSMAELTDLIWTAIDGLGSTSNSWVQAAANMLFLVIQEHGGNLTTILAFLLGCSTSLEALKSLLSTTGHWHDFAHLELMSAWEHFTSIHTYPQAVGLLARAMVQNHCKEIKAILSYLLPSLQSQQERERKTAILVLIEFLYSPALLEVISKQAVLNVLARRLQDTSSEIRVASLQGLGNILFHSEKGILLRGQLPAFLSGFYQNNETVVVGIMGMVSDVLHRLGTEGAGAQSLSIAINTRHFFDDERDNIRAAAMALFGDLVATMTDRELSGLRTQVCQSMVPLLLHLKDQCPAVVTQAKFTFYRCAVLLRWQPRHTLFCTLAWETGLSARHFLWTCLMTHGREEFSMHLSQAINYLHSHHRHIKTWAALFIAFKDLKKDPDPGIREFATRQLAFLREVSVRSKK